ncbi:hypothetical protein HRbin40_00589 [bacterium HR40]|nr:hypothetical protein HRbin40_00589 [bacterium HR40]
MHALRILPRPAAHRYLLGLLLSVLFLAAAAAVRAEGKRTGPSGLPLPRWASLASDEVNMRKGPGPEYPIRWVYRRKGLPVRIVDEADVWRKVEDPDGDSGWIHSSLLSSRRTVLVRGATAELRRTPSLAARVLLRAEPGVLGTLARCQPEWCLVEFDGVRGWVERRLLWGVDPAEAGSMGDG